MKCIECRNKINSNSLICPKCADLPQILDEWTTIDKTVPYLLKLAKRILKDFDKYEGDRFSLIEPLYQVILWTALNLKSFKENYQKPISPIAKFITENKILDNERMPKLIYNFDMFYRMSCLTLFLFFTENFLKSVNQELEQKYFGKSYSELVKHVLKQLHMNDRNNENYNSLYIPAVVRNTLHHSGVHTDNEYNGKINKILFKFKKNDSPNYASWVILVSLLNTLFLC